MNFIVKTLDIVWQMFHKENHKRTRPHAVLNGYDFTASHSIYGFSMGKLLILTQLVRTLWNCWDFRNIKATLKSVNSSKWQNLLTTKNTYKLQTVIQTCKSAMFWNQRKLYIMKVSLACVRHIFITCSTFFYYLLIYYLFVILV